MGSILLLALVIGVFTLICWDVYKNGGPIERIARDWRRGKMRAEYDFRGGERGKYAKGKQDSGLRVKLTPSFAEHLERCTKAGMTEQQAIRAWRRVRA